MRCLTAEEYDELREESAHNCEGEFQPTSEDEDVLIRRLMARGLVEPCDCAPSGTPPCIRLSPLGREAMRIHEAITAMVST
jgi:hypothetical protein